MSKRLSSILFPVSDRKKPTVGESSAERTPEMVDPTIRLDTSPAAQPTVGLYSTEGLTGIRVVADPAGATLEYDLRSNHLNDLF